MFTAHARTFEGIELYAATGSPLEFVEGRKDIKYFETEEEALEVAQAEKEQFDSIKEVWAEEVEE